jgi:excisionase family DNA binding protein
MPIEDPIGTQQAAKILKCCPATVRGMACKGEIPGVRINGGRWLFYADQLHAHIRNECLRNMRTGSSAEILAEDRNSAIKRHFDDMAAGRVTQGTA